MDLATTAITLKRAVGEWTALEMLQPSASLCGRRHPAAPLNPSRDAPLAPALLHFQRQACRLQRCSLHGLSPNALMCFWLNTYHALRLHAIMCAGPFALVDRKGGVDPSSPHFSAHYIVAGHMLSCEDIRAGVMGNRCAPCVPWW